MEETGIGKVASILLVLAVVVTILFIMPWVWKTGKSILGIDVLEKNVKNDFNDFISVYLECISFINPTDDLSKVSASNKCKDKEVIFKSLENSPEEFEISYIKRNKQPTLRLIRVKDKEELTFSSIGNAKYCTFDVKDDRSNINDADIEENAKPIILSKNNRQVWIQSFNNGLTCVFG